MIPYDEAFLIFTLPTTNRGTAKVVAGKGVKFIMCTTGVKPSENHKSGESRRSSL